MAAPIFDNPDTREALLAGLRRGGTLEQGAKELGTNRMALARARAARPDFDAAIDRAVAEGMAARTRRVISPVVPRTVFPAEPVDTPEAEPITSGEGPMCREEFEDIIAWAARNPKSSGHRVALQIFAARYYSAEIEASKALGKLKPPPNRLPMSAARAKVTEAVSRNSNEER